MEQWKRLHWVLDAVVLVFLVLDIATRDDITWISVTFWVLLAFSIGLNYAFRFRGRQTST